MRRAILILSCLLAFSFPGFSADLKPDATTDIPESAKRPVVVTLNQSEIRNRKSEIPKAILPDGMEMQIAAAAPLVTHPIMGCLDDRGRLFMGDCTGVNWNKKQLEANPPNRVVMLEDADKDGIFDKSTIFADKMTFPQGACWLDGSLYVMSPPGLWKLTDTNNDGVADQREMIVGGFEYTGNAADVHGPFLHPNGRLYWCHGRKGHKVVQKDLKTASKLTAVRLSQHDSMEFELVDEGLSSGIWSCNPDGSDVQWHSMACGDNPVEVDFTPEGDIIGTQNLYYSQPRGDTIVHWLYGGVYERPDQMKAIQGLPRTLETMPVMYNFGHVAVSGACFARSGVLFERSADTPVRNRNSISNEADKSVRAPLQFLVTHFNTQRVVRMELTPDGATYKATEHEFLRLPVAPDVHFTDVMEDTDGSILVVDTGGWFRIGCPSSLMAKPDLAGAVYRVKKAGGGNQRLAAKPATLPQKSLSELLTDLRSSDPRVQFRACELLTPQASYNKEIHVALLELLKKPLEPTLEHAALFACMHTGFDAAHPADAGNPDFARRMLIVGTGHMDCPSCREHTIDFALRYLDAKDDKLAATASWAVANTALGPEIASKSVENEVKAWFKDETLSLKRIAALKGVAGGLLAQEAMQRVISSMLLHADRYARIAALDILSAQSSGITNEAWLPPLGKAFTEATPGDLPLLLDAIKRLKTDRFNAKLQAIADDVKQSLPLRLKALDSMKAGKVTPKTVALLQDVLTGSNASAAAHIQAAEMLASAPLDATQTAALAPALASVGPVELQELTRIFKKNKDETLLRNLTVALAKNPAIGSLQESHYRNAFADKPTDLFENIVLPALRKANEATEAKKRLLPALAEKAASTGRPEEGRKHFEMGKGTCFACHKIGNAGRPIGPDLSKIGAIRTERDLLESILFPSNTLARDYEAHVIETSDGQSMMGVIKSHTAEGLLVVDVAGQEKNVPHASIVADTTLTTSLMPMGLDGTMSEQELCDLVAWLRSLR